LYFFLKYCRRCFIDKEFASTVAFGFLLGLLGVDFFWLNARLPDKAKTRWLACLLGSLCLGLSVMVVSIYNLTKPAESVRQAATPSEAAQTNSTAASVSLEIAPAQLAANVKQEAGLQKVASGTTSTSAPSGAMSTAAREPANSDDLVSAERPVATLQRATSEPRPSTFDVVHDQHPGIPHVSSHVSISPNSSFTVQHKLDSGPSTSSLDKKIEELSKHLKEQEHTATAEQTFSVSISKMRTEISEGYEKLAAIGSGRKGAQKKKALKELLEKKKQELQSMRDRGHGELCAKDLQALQTELEKCHEEFTGEKEKILGSLSSQP
jgi:hypothetical protein